VTYATACTARRCCIASSAGDAYYTSTLSFGCCGVSPLNILVTGGAGYVGSHACKALAAKGYVPITYDNLSRGNIWAVKWGPLEKGDIADGQRIRAVLEKYRPRALMHFAAYAYVGESVEQPLALLREQFHWHRGAPADGGRLSLHPHSFLIELRHLRLTRARSYCRGPSAASNQFIRA
jgi:NAD-dependent epimerase/dehydratase family protein